MKDEKDYRFPVALVKRLCPVCTKEVEDAGEILLGTRATKVPEGTSEVEQLHGKAVGFSDHFCKECTELIGENVWIAIIDESRSGRELKDYYRCGIIHGVKREAIQRMFKDWPGLPKALENQLMFLDYRVAQSMGFDVSSYLELIKDGK